MRWFYNFFLCCLLVMGLALPSSAAALQKRGQLSPEQGYNPNPADDDFILPMPCNLCMVFKAVDVPVQGFLWDVNFNMGLETSARDYYERRFSQAISGPFSQADLPAAWQKKLHKQKNVLYYFMGKYELSALQWRAVMEDQCPNDLSEKDLLPQNEISWYEAIEFTRRYNEWLLRNNGQALPRFKNDSKNIGYLRLPTEPEWEYAARGGNRVPPDALRQQEFYTLEPGAKLEDYAAFRPEGASRILDGPLRIGSRRPNPLGIYDMAGNVAEIMHDAFHFSLGNRLHGSAGGMVRKGGGFSGSQEEIMPGRREEIPLMHERGATKTRDMGMRLVLSGINTPDGGRSTELEKEWAKLGERSERIVDSANPIQEIDRIIELTTDSTAKANLTTLRGVIKDFNIELERQQSAVAEGLMRTVIYMMETIRNYAVRLNLSMDRIEQLQKDNQKESDKQGSVYKKRQEMIAQYQSGVRSFLDGIDGSVLFYKARLHDLAEIPAENYNYHLNLLQKEFSGSGVFQQNIANNIKTMDRHRNLAIAGKGADLTKEKLRDDILPPLLRTHLP